MLFFTLNDDRLSPRKKTVEGGGRDGERKRERGRKRERERGGWVVEMGK